MDCSAGAVMNKKIKIFDYDPGTEVFEVTAEYKEIADDLGISEWNPVVWIGRLFTMDNDFGEHWFDNWDLRKQKGREGDDRALIIDPDRFQDGKDGPCHAPEFRKRFWTDVLCSLELSLELLFEEAVSINNKIKKFMEDIPDDRDDRDDYIPDLDEKIASIKQRYT